MRSKTTLALNVILVQPVTATASTTEGQIFANSANASIALGSTVFRRKTTQTINRLTNTRCSGLTKNKGDDMKLSTLAWLAALIIAVYWLTSLGEAYYQAIYAIQDMKNAQIVQLMKD